MIIAHLFCSTQVPIYCSGQIFCIQASHPSIFVDIKGPDGPPLNNDELSNQQVSLLPE